MPGHKRWKFDEEDEREENGHILRRIRALVDMPEHDVCAGEQGGFLEHEGNLPQQSHGWVANRAKVYEHAVILGHAKVQNDASVYGRACICDHAVVGDYAQVYENALVGEGASINNSSRVFGNSFVGSSSEIKDDAKIFQNAVISGGMISDKAQVFGHAYVGNEACVRDEAKVYERARIFDNAILRGRAHACGFAQIFDGAEILEQAKIGGRAKIGGKAWIARDAVVFSDADWLSFDAAAIFRVPFNVFRDRKKGIIISICDFTDIPEKVDRVMEKRYANNPEALNQYRIFRKLASARFDIKPFL